MRSLAKQALTSYSQRPNRIFCPISLLYFSTDQAGANDEEDFPRGGAHALTPLEIREAKNEAEKDILFGVMVSYLI